MRVRAKKVTEDNIVFDSMAEHRRYVELKMLQRAGEIQRLQCHPTFRFVVNEQEVGKYTPDFQYLNKQAAPIVEDVKGFKRSPKTGKLLPRVDREFGLKRKLMKALFNIEVTIVG